MKSLILCLMMFVATANMALASEVKFTKTYGIHLYFNEQEFVDVLTLTRNSDGSLTGEMHVPNDFDGKITNVLMFGGGISFDLFVPKNAGRPQDLMFHYSGRFFDGSEEQLIGFVKADNDKEFVASFVGFIRK